MTCFALTHCVDAVLKSIKNKTKTTTHRSAQRPKKRVVEEPGTSSREAARAACRLFRCWTRRGSSCRSWQKRSINHQSLFEAFLLNMEVAKMEKTTEKEKEEYQELYWQRSRTYRFSDAGGASKEHGQCCAKLLKSKHTGSVRRYSPTGPDAGFYFQLPSSSPQSEAECWQ